ncbi:aminotransferase class V-fold PLP-dependent enzyme [Paracidobacterium acidisoli]|uniref:Aminotransferase class V-fold PLP-dependent enzyme n=1 Tax=Paracidobacterium acidisoli TaxID=2303751 RepID=A0A372IKN8_9BACT|nr:aminotransferase class V-fold PLP-dependent enzyme [Paracidobacterium acidisoli]MBT9332668.1 aminotransferase class V-fold PLP-dependent enzyme [Paracidobacterium acidisoli]
MERRTFIKWATALPLLAQVEFQRAIGTGWAQTAKVSTDNIYTRIGIKPVINGRGTWTYLSATLELPEVKAAQEAASQHFVNIFDLQHAVGRRLAELTGAQSGMITSGAAGAMASATAGCIAGTDPERVWQLPDTTGLKHEVVMMGGRSPFDSAIRLAGGKLVIAKSVDELANAITDNTAMVYTTSDPDTLVKEIAVTKRANVPIFMDAADGVPPIDKLQLFAKMGCDLFTVSGGKGLCGPQSSGVLLGRKDLIEAALANSNPWEGAVCRPMKVGKEEIMGCLAAVEAWYHKDLSALDKEWNGRVERIQKLIQTMQGVTTSIDTPPGGNSYPTLTVSWDQDAWGYTIADCARELLDGTPSIAVLTNDNPSDVLGRAPDRRKVKNIKNNNLQIISMTLKPGEEIIVGRRLRQLLSEAKSKKA